MMVVRVLQIIIGLSLLFSSCKDVGVSEKKHSQHEIELRLQNEIKRINNFVNKSSDYNRYIAFFIDMKLPSGSSRFFVVDLAKKKVIDKGLVAHGSGSETGIEGKLKFSNINNSNCTSLGKYFIGDSYIGQFGKAFKLHGLDPSNNNAFIRAIVLHKYAAMPYEEQNEPICNSLGCPMVNEKFYKRLERIIDHSEKKIILHIYY